MTFLDAVTALKNGECEGISCGGGYTLILKQNTLWVKGTDSMFDPNTTAIFSDWGLVNPKPLTETIPVTRWLYLPTTTYHVTPPDIIDPRFWVKLTGEMIKEVKPKVKRREEIGLNNDGLFWEKDQVQMGEKRPCPCRAKIYAEWFGE